MNSIKDQMIKFAQDNNYKTSNNNEKNNQYGSRNPQVERKNNANTLLKNKLKFDENYIENAEIVISNIQRDARGNIILTTSKIRKILSMVNEIYNEVILSPDKNLSEDQQGKIKYLKIRIIYEAGRERLVKDFVEKAKLIDYLNGIEDDKKEFIKFSRYVEALVAYHKYYGGRD